MADPVFDEIILPEQEEADTSVAVEPMQFDELILPHASGQFEEIVIPPKPKTETEKALLETPAAPTPADARPESPGRNKDGWYIEPGSLPDRIITWFGGGTEALARAEANRTISIPAERPPLALPIAKAIDTVAEKISGQPRVLQEMVEARTQEPKPEEPSFLNAGIPLVGPQEGTAAQIAAGVANVPIGFANFLLSPGGVATMQGLGMLPKLVQTLVGLGFTAEQVKGFVEAETLQDKITTGVGAAFLGTVTGIQAKQLRKPASEPGPAPATTERAAPETPQGVEPGRQAAPIEHPLGSFDQFLQRAEEITKRNARVEFDPSDPAYRELYEAGRQGKAALDQKIEEMAFGELDFSRNIGDETAFDGPPGPGHDVLAEARATANELREIAGLRLIPELTSQTAKRAEPIGTTEAIAEIQRRNAPSTEPVIPNEPAGTKFAEPVVIPQAAERTLQQAEQYLAEGNHEMARLAAHSSGANPPFGEQFTPAVLSEITRRQNLIDAATKSEFSPKNEPKIMSPGPGAASAKETLASYEQRRFGKRFQETEGMSPEIREATGNRYYEPISNKLTFEEAGKIIEERGTDNAIRLVRDENFAMEPRVRATLAQSLVTKLNQSHAEATAAGDVTRAKGFLDQAVDTAEYLGEFGTRLGQGVQSFAIWSKLTPEGMLESAKRSAKRANVELTPEQQAEIRRLAQEAHEAKEGIPKQDATKKLAKYMVEQTGIPAGDLPLAVYYTHILSGIQTHVVNAVDTGLNVTHEVNNLAVSNPRAASFVYAGLMRGLGEGKYDALLSLQEGRRIVEGKFIESPDLLEVSTFGEKGGVPIAVKGVASKVARRLAESKIAKPLNTYKYVMRMMSASDAVWFRGAEEARAGLLAHRLAEATGVERARLKSEVDRILGYGRLPEFRAEAAREGYTGAKAEARATELMIQSRPEALRADASDYAGVSTYNHTPRGVLGYFANGIAQWSNKYPVLKLFVPFTRIVANVTNRGLDNTPMGILRSLREKGLSKEQRQQLLTRGVIGTTGMIGLGVLNATGAIQIHGAGPPDPEKKRQLQSAGWKPFSIEIGGNYYTYTYTPIGLGVSVLGNYLDSQRYKTLEDKDALTRATYAMSRIGQTVFSQSYLSSLSNLFTILSGDPGRSVNSLKQFFSNVATAATTPNLARDINHLFDPSARKSENIAQDLIRNIPIARLNLRPTLNAFGEPVILSRNRFFSGQSDDPAWRVVVDKNLRVPVVDQTTFEDSEDGYLYAKIAGERMRKYIVSNLPTLNRATDENAQDMLSKASRAMFDEARQDVMRRGGVKKKRKR